MSFSRANRFLLTRAALVVLLANSGCAIHPSRFFTRLDSSAVSHEQVEYVSEPTKSSGEGVDDDRSEPSFSRTDRGVMKLDFSEFDAKSVRKRIDPDRKRQYAALSASECLCRAARASAVANLLKEERLASGSIAKTRVGGAHSGDRTQQRVLRAAEEEARDRSAAAALEIFYHIAELEGQLDLAKRGEKEIDQALAKLEKVREQGLPAMAGDAELKQQQADSRGKRLEILHALATLNARLARLLDTRLHERIDGFWPEDTWKVTAEAVNAETSAARANERRADLKLLKNLDGALDGESLSSARQVLGRVDRLAGMATRISPVALLVDSMAHRRGGVDKEVVHRRRQIRQYRAVHEREVGAEVRQAAMTVDGKLEEVSVRRENVRAWRRRIGQLEAQNTAGKANFLEITQARLKTWQAESDLLSAVVAWKIARVQLRVSEGGFSASCGAQSTSVRSEEPQVESGENEAGDRDGMEIEPLESSSTEMELEPIEADSSEELPEWSAPSRDELAPLSIPD